MFWYQDLSDSDTMKTKTLYSSFFSEVQHNLQTYSSQDI